MTARPRAETQPQSSLSAANGSAGNDTLVSPNACQMFDRNRPGVSDVLAEVCSWASAPHDRALRAAASWTGSMPFGVGAPGSP